MPEPYGLSPGTAIDYGALGFPAWVDDLCRERGLDSSTYPGHQTGDRPDIGAAPNPDGLNRGIDWTGPPDRMLDFARWLVSIGPARESGRYGPPGLEMVIYQDPRDGARVWYPDWVDYGDDFPNHTDHVHVRTSAALPTAPRPAVLTVPLVERGGGRWGSPNPAWDHLIERESSGDPTVVQQIVDANSGGNEAEGLFQITPATWRAHRGDEFAPSPRLATPAQQAIVAARIFTANPSGSDWGAGLPGREDAGELAAGLVPAAGQTGGPPPVDIEDDDRRMLREIHAALFNPIPSQSPYRTLGEGARWRLHEMVKNDDGMIHPLWLETEARDGDPDAIADITAVAAGDPSGFPDRARDIARARRFLDLLRSAPAQGGPPGQGGGGASTQPPVVAPPYTPPPPPPIQPSPQPIVLLTVSGHLADMWTGYPSDLARELIKADPSRWYHQPVGNWDPNALPLGRPCDDAYREIVRQLTVVHPTGPWSLASYSQGAIPASRVYMALADGGELASRRDDFVGGVTWGNPYREQGSYVGARDPGGHGISGARITGTGPLWRDYADPGDIYTNVSGPSGQDCTAIYDMAMYLNPAALMGEVLKLFLNPAPELMAMVQAIIQGIQFGASSPPTAAHVQYQWRECVPGKTYFAHAVEWLRDTGARTTGR